MVTKSTEKVKSSTSSASPLKKAKMSKAPKPQDKPAHPKTSDMVNTAIKELADRSGSSLMAIKKYIAEKYDLDSEKKTAFYIRKYLKQAVEDGSLVRTKGKGANGSFKMPSAAVLASQRREAKALKGPSQKEKPKKPATAKKSSSSEKASLVKKQAPAKTAGKTPTDGPKPKISKPAGKTPTDGPKPKIAKLAANKTTSKSPKAKKITKTPTSKPKAPRPRKVIAASKSPKLAAKKVVAVKAM